MSVLNQIAIFLLAAVIAVPLFRKLKLGAVLGYLAAGIALGPFGLAVIKDIAPTLHFAEFGVVLLLFVIGLELQPSRLWVLRRTVFGLGSAQVAVTTVVLGAVAWLLGLNWQSALVVGFGLSLSSTPLVLQLLAERGQLTAHHGRAAFGILLLQDLAVMPMLALLPLLGHGQHPIAQQPWWLAAGKLVLVLAAVVAGSRLLLRPLLRVVAGTRITEVFTAAALLVVLATALLVDRVGLSMALGAFLAGVMLADSEFRHELEADIEPFKGLLLGLFFISVGMSANLGLLAQEPMRLLVMTLGFMTLKLMLVFLIASVFGHDRASARRLAFALPAGGEFAFVLFALGVQHRVLDPDLSEQLVIAVSLSMALSPLLLSLYDFLAARYASPAAPFDTIEERGTRVIVAGFGRFGQVVSRVLRARRIPFTVLEASQTQVDFVRRFGNKVYYGDASRLELLRAARADEAQVFILAIDDVEASVRTARLVRAHFPHLRIFARARNRQHAFALMDLGVRHVIRETFASSLEMATEVLEALGASRSEALSTVTRFRAHDEQTLKLQYAVKDAEQKLVQSSRESARQLEELFGADSAAPQPEAAER
jgi:monovalent cation:proton antiporter-2 (CPA2) family protein